MYDTKTLWRQSWERFGFWFALLWFGIGLVFKREAAIKRLRERRRERGGEVSAITSES